MDLFTLIIILLAGYIIKYLIDTINSLNREIKEIKEKCIKSSDNVKFKTKTEEPNIKINRDLINSISYFKDFFDNKDI
jgi:FtsZ-binding cell division protein ZapB